jgi:dienelactone hydrolase
MRKPGFVFVAAILFPAFASLGQTDDADFLPGTKPLTMTGDLSAQMVAGIDKFLSNETDRAITERAKFWNRVLSSSAAYEKSVVTDRHRLRLIIGAVDVRVASPAIEVQTNLSDSGAFTIQAVRWPVFESVYGEGLLLRPKTPPVARIIAIPDADQNPEMLAGLAPGLPPERQFARRLVENGCEVLVPVLIDRQDTWSGNERIHHLTNQPHREWIYRQAFELGRHIIGYEVQKVLAAVDCWQKEEANSAVPIGVAGYAEGGLIAFYAAALDPRIKAAMISGYFDSRQRLWDEPIYRNVFGLLQQFGDSEIAALVAPRTLIIEYSPVPKISGPPKPREGRAGAAPGKLQTPDYESVELELERARKLLKGGDPKVFDHFNLISGNEGMATGPASDRALAALLNGLDQKIEVLKEPGKAPADARASFDPADRQLRQLKELEAFTQKTFAECETARSNFFWNKIKATSADEWQNACAPFRTIFWEQTVGNFPASTTPPNPRSRKLQSTITNVSAYEIVLDVLPDVFAWGYLLVPKSLKSGERRPVVVCQHGLEGVPSDVITSDPSTEAFRYYKSFAARLAEQGFVVFAPHNPYRGGNTFRQLQRKANPLGKSLFSIIIAQHERILDWLSELPFVDAKRIGFYGLSYGGKTAMRVPAVLPRYALSICSGDFNEWVKKNVSTDLTTSYMFGGEYEMPEFDLGHTFDYAEMAALIAPRPFMVERGHNDPVGLDDWVAREYAKVQQLYYRLQIPDRTAIEFFDGPHTINGVGSFEFLHKHLDWPVR